MNLKKTLLGLMVASSFGVTALPAQAELIVRVAPPAPRVEVVPAARPGYTWSGGYYRWNGHHHVWTGGHFERNRPGYVYHSPSWVEHDGRWSFQSRRWDRDGDGVPDSRDAHPNNPNRS